jgi:hypothetical protein
MSALKNRLKAVEAALMPPVNADRFMFVTICTQTDDGVIGYEYGGVSVMRLDGESIDGLKERAKAAFLSNRTDPKVTFFIIRTIYTHDD